MFSNGTLRRLICSSTSSGNKFSFSIDIVAVGAMHRTEQVALGQEPGLARAELRQLVAIFLVTARTKCASSGCNSPTAPAAARPLCTAPSTARAATAAAAGKCRATSDIRSQTVVDLTASSTVLNPCGRAISTPETKLGCTMPVAEHFHRVFHPAHPVVPADALGLAGIDPRKERLVPHFHVEVDVVGAGVFVALHFFARPRVDLESDARLGRDVL